MSKNNGSAVTRDEAVALIELVEEVAITATEVPEPVVFNRCEARAGSCSPETFTG